MQKFKLDAEKSKEVFDRCGNIKVKECYNNIFKVVTEYPSMFHNNVWRVAYGYMLIFDNLYCRHCFVIDENNKIIDPTIYATEREDAEAKEYYAMFIFDDMGEYLKAVEHEEYMPGLEYHLREKDVKAQMWARDNGMIFIQ